MNDKINEDQNDTTESDIRKYPKVLPIGNLIDKSRIEQMCSDHKLIVETNFPNQLEGINCTWIDGKMYTKNKVTNKVVEIRDSLENKSKNKNTI